MAFFGPDLTKQTNQSESPGAVVDRNIEQAIKRDIYSQLQAGVPASEVAKMIGTKYADNANLAVNIWRSDAVKVDNRSRDTGNQLITEYANLAKNPNYQLSTTDPNLSADRLSYLDSRSEDLVSANIPKRSGINKAVGALGKVTKFAVPAAIATIGTAGLGSVLSGAGTGLGAVETGVSAGNSVNSGGLVSSLSSSFAPKQAALGALKGGIGGYISSGDLSGALRGAGLGGLTGGYSGAVAKELGLQGAGASAFQGAAQGASGGLAQGDVKQAGLGALLAGGGAYATAGGSIPFLGNVAGASLDQTTGIEGLQGPTQGSGLIGTASRGLSSLTQSVPGTLSGGGNMNLSSILRPASSLYGAYSARQSEDEAKDALLAQQDKSKQALQPFLNSGLEANNLLLSKLLSGELGGNFNPGDLTQTPGYQFNLEQGQKALDRTQAARGNLYSGAALKEASRYSQGLAEQTYNDEYNRWLGQQQNTFGQLSNTAGQGQNAANSMGNIYDNIGNIQANSSLTRNNIKSAALAQLLSGIDPSYSNPFYF